MHICRCPDETACCNKNWCDNVLCIKYVLTQIAWRMERTGLQWPTTAEKWNSASASTPSMAPLRLSYHQHSWSYLTWWLIFIWHPQGFAHHQHSDLVFLVIQGFPHLQLSADQLYTWWHRWLWSAAPRWPSRTRPGAPRTLSSECECCNVYCIELRRDV